MNYITNYYKNLSEQLQEKVNYLASIHKLLNEAQATYDPTRDNMVNAVSDMYGYNMGTANPNYSVGGNVMQTNNMGTYTPGRPSRPPQGGFGTSNRPVQPGAGFGTSSGGGQPRPPQGGFGTNDRPVQPGAGFGTSSGGGQPGGPQVGVGGNVSRGFDPMNPSSGRNNQAGLAMFMSAWGTNNPEFDYNGDGIVDGADLGIFLGQS